ncbi:MAG: magnesium transporter [Planctomycetaceae bacterium]|jgi:magnesium transporter|nr:magnesium transporter [Planctomycetaceae bacterium]
MNTLFLPELREMLAEDRTDELREFCTALHPARTAEFMEGLDNEETWRVLQHAQPSLQAEVFQYFDIDRQVDLIASQDEKQIAVLVTQLPADDAVDLLRKLPEARVDAILALVPAPDRRDIRRLQTFKEGTAGAMMTTEVACLSETLTVRQALDELSRQAERLETIYYIYVVDDTNHLRGVVSGRLLISSIGRPETRLADLMKSDVVSVNVNDDQEQVAQKVAFYNIMAVPVVDDRNHMMGIITHDDVIDVVREEAAEDVQRIVAVAPLSESYLRTPLLILSWKRGFWLLILFFAALSTAFALKMYQSWLDSYAWLVLFIPLIISSGGNSGSQSSTLIISALATKDIELSDWGLIVRREIVMGLLLGGIMGSIGYLCALFLAPTYTQALIIPITILCVVLCGTCMGSVLPLMFKRMGLDPAMMSNQFVAGLSDLLGILIYVNVALLFLS